MSDKIPTPIKGYCVVRRVERGKTEGGLHISVASEANDRFYIVKTSGVFFEDGVMHEHGAKEGDEVLCIEKILAPPSFPRNMGLARLDAIPVYYPAPDDAKVALRS